MSDEGSAEAVAEAKGVEEGRREDEADLESDGGGVLARGAAAFARAESNAAGVEEVEDSQRNALVDWTGAARTAWRSVGSADRANDIFDMGRGWVWTVVRPAG